MDLTGTKQVYLTDFTVSDIFYKTSYLILHRGEQIFKKTFDWTLYPKVYS